MQEILDLEHELALLELEAARREYRAHCQKSFLAFVRHMRPEYVQEWFHLRLIQIFQDIGDGKIKRATISIPPRHTKTEHCRLFTAWYMGNNPNKKIIGTSYSEEISSDSNRAVQTIMTSEKYLEIFPNITLPSSNVRTVASRKLRNSSVFEIEGYSGQYYSAGITGGLTGKGATGGIIIDDPTKNYSDAIGAVRTKLENEWKYSIRSRAEGGAFIIIIMTRWSMDDFVGSRLTEAANDPNVLPWTEINFPAVKDDIGATDDPRALGDTLWPTAGYDKKWAAALKAGDEEAWQAQYQQRPVVVGGGIIKTFRLRFWYPDGCEPQPVYLPNNEGELVQIPQMALPAHMGSVTQSWDLTFKKTESGSYIVGQAWGSHAPQCPTLSFLLHQRRFRGDFEEGVSAIEAMKVDFPSTRRVLIEDKANGPATQSRLKGRVSGITMVTPQGDKIERAHAAAEIHTDVVVPHPGMYPWVKEYLAELAAFPKGRFDDCVDATTQYINDRYSKPKFKAF